MTSRTFRVKPSIMTSKLRSRASAMLSMRDKGSVSEDSQPGQRGTSPAAPSAWRSPLLTIGSRYQRASTEHDYHNYTNHRQGCLFIHYPASTRRAASSSANECWRTTYRGSGLSTDFTQPRGPRGSPRLLTAGFPMRHPNGKVHVGKLLVLTDTGLRDMDVITTRVYPKSSHCRS
jgi:hypothetical protein